MKKPNQAGDVQNNREQQEKDENLKTITRDVPESRMQREQQIQPAAEAEEIESAKSSFSKTVKKPKGQAIKLDKVAEQLGGQSGQFTGSSMRSVSYSGNTGDIAGSSAYTPIVGNTDRSTQRLGKKLDSTAKKVNYIPSEQFIIGRDQSQPLAASPDSVQGYNGTIRNENARAQKNNGAVPQDTMFQRSIDENRRDQRYFVMGQLLYGSAQDGALAYPTIVPEVSDGV